MFWHVAVVLVVLLHVMLPAACTLGCPQAIFAFGDSLTDTGNYGTLYPTQKYPTIGSMAFVSDFNYQSPLPGFSNATGVHRMNKAGLPYRSGNGRLIIDFLAQAFGFPFLPANFQSNQDISHGVNFAVASATARDTANVVPWFLSAQVKNFMNFKGYYSSPDTITNALFFIFIGTNDFWQNLNRQYTIDRIESEVIPDAMQKISNALYDLHYGGARTVMVVGLPALGCLPIFLSNFGTGNPSDYDELGCLKAYNDAVRKWNGVLLGAVQGAQASFPNSTYMFADIFRIHINVESDPTSYGLSSEGIKSACCGGGGQYNVPVQPCGSATAAVCSNPSSYVSWDGLHFTEGFNRLAAVSFLKGYYVVPWPDADYSTLCGLDFSKF